MKLKFECICTRCHRTHDVVAHEDPGHYCPCSRCKERNEREDLLKKEDYKK